MPITPSELLLSLNEQNQVKSHRAPICPECRSGKHGNCDGSALDERADDIVECRCPPAFHPEKRS